VVLLKKTIRLDSNPHQSSRALLPRSSRKPSLRLREVESSQGSSDPANDMEDGPLGIALFGHPFSGPGGVEL
jgi:hypothetical protein